MRGMYFPDELVGNLLLFVSVICFLVIVIILFQLTVSRQWNQDVTSSWSCLMFSPMYFPWDIVAWCLIEIWGGMRTWRMFIFAIGAYYYDTLIRRRHDVASKGRHISGLDRWRRWHLITWSSNATRGGEAIKPHQQQVRQASCRYLNMVDEQFDSKCQICSIINITLLCISQSLRYPSTISVSPTRLSLIFGILFVTSMNPSNL